MMQTAPARLDRPRFRQDLIAEAIDEQGARFIDVMDPDTGNVFRFYEVEYSLACAMDGERDVPGIMKWAQEELGLTPSPQEVRSVIATLGDLGFIDTGAAREAAPELAPSVVVGPPAKAPPSPDLELGAAGPSTPAREPRRTAPEVALGAPGASRSPDVALGAPGAPSRRTEPGAPVEDFALGAPGARSSGAAARRTPPAGAVSLDLSEHIEVRPNDVKEAVRASKMMTAVEPPHELLADKPSAVPGPAHDSYVRASQAAGQAAPVAVAPPAPSSRTPTPVPSRKSERSLDRPPDVARPPDLPFSRPSDVAPTQRSIDPGLKPGEVSRPSRPAVELPRPPAAAPAAAAVPAAAQARVSTALVVVLVLVFLGAAGFFVWKYVLDSSDGEVDTSASPALPSVKPAPPLPPPPPAPASKIVMEVPAPDEIKLGRPGVIETILPANAAVKASDVVVRLVGDRPIEAERSGILRDLKRTQDQIDALTKRRDAVHTAGNKAAETAAQTEIATKQGLLATKQGQLATKTADLEKFLLRAPSDGTFAPSVKNGQKITADDVVATLQRAAIPVALFKLADTRPFTANATVEVNAGKDQHLSCTIAVVQPDVIKVACPADPSIAEGTDVTLTVPAALPAPTELPVPTGAAPTGAAPTGAAPAGTAPTELPVPAGAAPTGAAPAGAAPAPEAPAAGSAAVPAAGASANPAPAPTPPTPAPETPAAGSAGPAPSEPPATPAAPK